MNISREEIQNRMEHFAEKLKKENIKLTHQRIEIFREVAQKCDHPDAEAIYRGVRERIPTVSLDTVYRTLWMLIDKGLLTTLEIPGNRIRFDANLDLHHHFVCTRCGMTSDFSNSELIVLVLNHILFILYCNSTLSKFKI